MPGIAARNGYNETQLEELKSHAKGSERVTIPKPITAEKYDAAMKSQRDWEKRQREDNEVGARANNFALSWLRTQIRDFGSNPRSYQSVLCTAVN